MHFFREKGTQYQYIMAIFIFGLWKYLKEMHNAKEDNLSNAYAICILIRIMSNLLKIDIVILHI